MRYKLLFIFSILTICLVQRVQAYSFSAVCSTGQTLYYNITSSISPYTIEVTSRLNATPYYSTKPIGSIIIPDSVTYNGTTYSVNSIGNNAFKYCSGITAITIPNTVTLIANYAFTGCSGLTSISISNSVSYIGSYAFQSCSGLTNITIPNSVTSIGNDAFSTCSMLTNITIPNSVTSIGNSAFNGCIGLTSVSMGNSLISIGSSAFNNCSSLIFVSMGSSVVSIGSSAFYGCSGLTSITIPKFVTSIGSSAFYGCSGLTSITCKAINPPLIQNTTFYGVSKLIPLFVPCVSKSNYQIATDWNSFSNYIGVITPLAVSSTICQGEVYTGYGAQIDSAGTYTFISGCDSINLTLAVNPKYSHTINDTICQGQTYSKYGFNVSTIGQHIRNLQTINGCDSIIILNLAFYTTPTLPTNLSVQNMHNYLEITWSGNGASYELYRNDTLFATLMQPIYIDTNVINAQPYCYKIKSFIGDCESDLSNIVCKSFSSLKDKLENEIVANLYPNPANAKTTLEIDGLNKKVEVKIIDLVGRVIETYTINEDEKKIEIDVSDFSKGVYSVLIHNFDINIYKKLIVK